MVKSNLKLIIAFCLIVCASCSSRPCVSADIYPCICSNLQTETGNKTMVTCSGHGLESVPSNLPADTAILDFSDNMLGYGDLSTLCEYAHLEHVSLANNHISTIGKDDLRRCEISNSVNFARNKLDTVTKLSLNGLQFTQSLHGLEANDFTENAFSDMLMLTELEMTSYQNELSSEIFRGTKIDDLYLKMPNAMTIPETLLYPLKLTLSKFTLESSSIQKLPNKFFHNLTKLQEINLHLVYQQSMPEDLFQSEPLTKSLQSISLYDIKNISPGLFTSLDNLHHLTIHGTSSLPDDLFLGLFSLVSLELRKVELDRIPRGLFINLRSLIRLEMKECDLTVISHTDIEHLDSLEVFDISKNKIRLLEPGLFHDIGDSLMSLNMSFNYLKEIPNGLFVRNTKIQSLDLGENHISRIQPRAFEMLTELKYLYLNNNKLCFLDANTFALNTKLFFLELSSNSLIDLPGELFKNTSLLSVLKLSNNMFSKLKKSIFFNINSSLSELNVNYNQIECDCEIVEIVNILNTVNITGKCYFSNVKISIVEFAANYSCDINSEDLEIKSPPSVTVVPYAIQKYDKTGEQNISLESVKQISTKDSDLNTLNTSSSTVASEGIEDARLRPRDVGHVTSLSTTSVAPELSTLNKSEFNQENDATDVDLSAQLNDQSLFDMNGDQVLFDRVTDSMINSSSVHHMVTSHNRVTADPHNVSEEDGEYFYISLASILSVTVFSFLILVFLYCKKRRARRYHIARPSNFAEVGDSSYSFGKYIEYDYRNDSLRSLTPLREVPSIQIESVDDDGNIRVEFYNPKPDSDGTRV